MNARDRALPDALALICSACGARSVDPFRFGCPARVEGDDVDHVLVPPEPDQVPWPATPSSDAADIDPFHRYRTLLYPYRLHRAWGGGDAGFVALVERLQAAVAATDGRPFRMTPLRRFDGAALVPGPAPSVVWVKDETVNVSGSHKGRHFMGLALYLSVLELHLGKETRKEQPLAIASCGNAALAASVLARALGRAIDVFVPPGAAPSVLARLEALGATVNRCPRMPDHSGDPCLAAFESRVERGALPFSAQGPSNGLALDGATTLGYELADQWRTDLATVPTRLFVQVGGGALASSAMTGLRRARQREVLGTIPELHTVQARNAAPFSRAVDAVDARCGADSADPAVLAQILAHLARHRSEAMQPWSGVPQSAASAILDDETYDWRSVAEALFDSGGRAVLVNEKELIGANERARLVTGIDVDCTGSAGLAGLWAATDAETATSTAAPVAVLFTGAQR